MHKYLCFIDKEDIDEDLLTYISALDEQGAEVYLYSNFSHSLKEPTEVLYELDRNYGTEEDTYVFLTNMKSLFNVIYRIYNQSFNCFLYYEQEDTRDYELTGIYRALVEGDISGEELNNRRIYSNIGQVVVNKTVVEAKDYMVLLNNSLLDQEIKELDNQEAMAKTKRVRKYYYFQGKHVLFEPILGDQTWEYDLDSVSAPYKQDFVFPGFDTMIYLYSYNSELLNQLFTLMDNVKVKLPKEHLITLFKLTTEMQDYYPYVYNMTCSILEDAASLVDEEEISRSLFIYSYLMQVTMKERYYVGFLKLVLESKYLTGDNLFYIWNQCKRYSLARKVVGNQETTRLMKEIYHKAFQYYKEQLCEELHPIPNEERDRDAIVIFAIQFISERHAPTRTTLERCYTLGKRMSKKLILVNTIEQCTPHGGVNIYQSSIGNVIEEYSQIHSYRYKDYDIPFFQPLDPMPSLAVVRELFKMIRSIKPYMIFSIGNGSIVADLCGQLVPHASIGVAFSKLATSKALFSVIGRKIREEEWGKLYKEGYSKESIIESTFTFELSKKKTMFRRADFNLPEKAFLLVVVGIRLDSEVDDDFFEMLQKTYPWGTHVVFAGNFSRYEEFCNRHCDLKEHSTFIGYCNDILALMELCDLYINPRRLGGGFSIIEAFHEGVPGVTINTGDVAVAAGEEFCVRDYDEMTEVISRYIKDREFYNQMVQKGKEREMVVTDSPKAMQEILDKIQSSPIFF